MTLRTLVSNQSQIAITATSGVQSDVRYSIQQHSTHRRLNAVMASLSVWTRYVLLVLLVAVQYVD